MKRIILLISLAAITLTACKSHYKPVLTSGQGINFKVTSLDSALNEVKAAKKPLFVFAHASWCPTCREMEQTVLMALRVRQVHKDHKAFKVFKVYREFRVFKG